MIPATAFQLIRMRFATARTLASRNQAATSVSNAAVYLDRPSAHGTGNVATPCSGQSTLGTPHTKNVRYPQASRFPIRSTASGKEPSS